MAVRSTTGTARLRAGATKGYNMLNDITLGQYYPAESPIHLLDPRSKILLTIAYIIAVFLAQSYIGFLFIFVMLTICVALSSIPAKYFLLSLKPLLWILVFTFVLNLFFIPGETVLFRWWIISITTQALEKAVFLAIRLVLLIAGTSVLTLSTSPILLTDGIERLLSPLKALKFPAHELAMMMTIALRFIPTLLEEAQKIMKAQMSRGADFESGNLLKRARNLVPLLVPLFVSAFRRAEELAMAMEARCYHGGEGRTRLRVLRFARRDFISFIVMAAFIAGIAVWG